MSARARRRHRQAQRTRRSLVWRTAPLTVAVAAALTAGTALTAGVGSLPQVSADRHTQAWPSFTLTAGPSYATVDGVITVTFAVSPAAGQARAQMDATGWSSCTSGDAGTTWSCTVANDTGSFSWVAVP
jgi:crotonobetainyl-CoA:carnitine CoA-transferase CaiB-like acyl-CoA transferase